MNFRCWVAPIQKTGDYLMTKRLCIIFFITSILTFPFSVTAKEDIQGWDKTRWGMSPEVVAELYHLKTKNLDFKSGYCFFDLVQNKSDQLPHHNIRAFFDEKNGLNRIYEYFEVDEFDINHMNLPEATNIKRVFELICNEVLQKFNSLEENMTIQYGKPTLNRQGDNEQLLMWVFPTTVIRLKRIENSIMCTTTIEFTPKDDVAN